MTSFCPTCGQPLPEEARRDPPLRPLDVPAVVTIHDLPPEVRANVEIIPGSVHQSSKFTLRTARTTVERRERKS